MKALTLTQPWATLVAIGAKQIETRSWPTTFRGPVAIHAAKGFPPEARALVDVEPFRSVLAAAGIRTARDLPLGAVVAVGHIPHVWQFGALTESLVRERSRKGELPPHEADFGDFAADRWGFAIADVRRLDDPIPCRGALGLWTLPDALRDELRERELVR